METALQAARNNLTSSKEEIESIRSALEQKSQECEANLQQVASFQSTVAELQVRVHSKETEREALQRSQVDQQRDHESELHSRIVSLQDQNVKLMQECDQLKNTVERNVADMKGLHRERYELQATLERVEETMEQKLLEAKASLDNANSTHGEETKKLKAFAVKVKRELAETKEQVSLWITIAV